MSKSTYLISTQSYQHETDSQVEIPTQYGYLVETDFRGFTRLLRIITPTYSPYNERIKPGLRGLFVWKDKVYVASWNMIHIVDYISFQRIDSFSHPLMGDIHGIYVDEDGIWVTSSLIDSILKFDWNRDLNHVLPVSNTPLYPRKDRKPIDLLQDYRLRGKLNQGFQNFHVNHVIPYNNQFMMITGRGQGKRNGRIILVDKETLRYRVWFRGLYGPHDGLAVAPGVFAFTETVSSSIAIVQKGNWLGSRLKRRLNLPNSGAKFWTRGLCISRDDHFLVGKSVWKGDNRYASIVEITQDGTFITEHTLELKDYPECRIFQIVSSPES